HAVFETFQRVPDVLGATGQQIVVGHRTGAVVEVDLGSHRGGDILRQLVDGAGQHRHYSPNGLCRHAQSVSKLEISVSVEAFRSSTASMGLGYIRRRCTSKAKHSSATSLGRERDRPVCFSIRRNRWRTVFGWQISTSAAARTDASLSRHTRNVSNSIARSWSGRPPKPSNAAPTVLIIASGALTAAVARMEPSNTATEDAELVGP